MKMREIKFRAWDGKKMTQNGIHISLHGYQWNWVDGQSLHGSEINTYPLMQFTGLLDKNSVEIYEGDIVKYEGYREKFTGLVKFGEFDAYWPTGAHEWASAIGYYVSVKDQPYSLSAMSSFKHDGTPFTTIEIIGNLHENLELIKN